MSATEFSIPVFLQKQPYFAALPEERLRPLAQQAVQRSLAADEIVFLEGEPSAGLWLIDKGQVKVYKVTAQGREHVLHLLGPGDTFNDIPALDGAPNPASAMAVTDQLALAVLRGLTKRIRRLVVQIEDLALRSVTARLARFLLEQTENPSLSGPAITRALIATHLATSPETVSRALRTLEETGALSF